MACGKVRNDADKSDCAFGDAFVTAHFKLAANERALLVYRARQGATIKRSTPAIVGTRHGSAAPFVGINKPLGHTCFADQHYFQPTTTGLAICAADITVGQVRRFDVHFAVATGKDTLLPQSAHEPSYSTLFL